MAARPAMHPVQANVSCAQFVEVFFDHPLDVIPGHAIGRVLDVPVRHYPVWQFDLEHPGVLQRREITPWRSFFGRQTSPAAQSN